MKKISLLPLVAALAVAGTAQAQTAPSVTVYGQMDVMFTSLTDDNNEVLVNEGATSRLGFRGEDKLNNGMTAFFQLEERFNTDSATADTPSLRWKDKAWVGLRGGFGEVVVGNVPTALDIIYGAAKAANLETQADWNSRKGPVDTRITNGIQYTSPAFGPVTLYISHAQREATNPQNAHHDGISMNFKLSDAAYVEAGFQRDTDGWQSIILNGGFKISPSMEIIAAVADHEGYDYKNAGTTYDPVAQGEQRRYNLGVKMSGVAGGDLWITGGRAEVTSTAGVEAEDYHKLGVGYRQNLSSRVSWLSAISYAQQDGAFGRAAEDSQFGVQTGLRMRF